MADISTGRQRGIVPFVDETTGRLPDQYLPQGVIDLQGDLEQAVTDASQSATAAKASETAAKTSADSATQSASAAAQSAESASGDAAAAKASADGAASSASAAKSSETAAASSAAAAAESKAAAKASETAAAQSAQTATEQVSSIGDSVERAAASATAAQQSAAGAASSASNASQSASSASTSASQASGFASTASQAATTATGAASNASESATTAQQSASEASESATTAQQSASEASASASAAKVSETNAAASATAAQQAVDGFGLEVGTTTTGEPGTNAAVEIQKNGSKYTANFTIPRGDVGPAGVNENVPLGSTSGVVAQASDAYPALPRKVQVHGRTINNLWGNPVGSSGGFAASQNANGSLHISGTGGSNASIAKTITLSPSTQYTLACNKSSMDIRGFMVRENFSTGGHLDHTVAGSDVSGNLTNTFTTSPDLVSVGLYVLFSGGQTVNDDYKLMIVEGDTAPDLFVPSGVHAAEPTKLIISGVNFADLSQAVRYKNLGAVLSSKTSSKIEYTGANSDTDTLFDLGITLPAGAYYIDYGNNVSNIGANIQDVTSKLSPNGFWGVYYGNPDRITFDEPFNLFISPKAGSGVIDDFQISLTDSKYKEPIVSNINIPSDISLADGDTLIIDRDGTTRIVHSEGEPTVLEDVTLPELPAPTFNVYTTGGYVPPTVDVDYERDVNLVLQALEAKIAALQVADKTN